MQRSNYSMEALTRRRPLTSRLSFQEDSAGASGEKNNEQQQGLQRTLNVWDVIFYGVGCSVGAGIYSLVGIGAKLAGPSIALSFLLCGIACCFTSLSYAELSARIPIAGSAYSFCYVAFGEIFGWLVGWNLTLGYGVSACVVARSWAEYLTGFIGGLFLGGEHALRWLTHAPIPLFGADYTCCPLSMVIIGLCTMVLVSGAKESTRFNTAMTLLNLSVLGFVLLAGVGSGTVHSDNLIPVFPHGFSGMGRGAGLVFFAYLGFDMVACLSEEVKDPQRNMPIGIIGSLLTSMTLYVSVCVVVVGMVPVSLLGEDVPIVNALLANACCPHEEQLQADAAEECLSYSCHPILHPILYYGSRMISFGAIFGLTTATFACLMGQPRIFYSMATDGLLFKIYARVHPKTGVPTVGTIITGVCTALLACLVDLESLANVISLGTLQVFTFVNAGVILLRMRPLPGFEAPSSLALEDIVEEESSPLVSDPDGNAFARHLGIVKKTSSQIRYSSIRSIGSIITESTSTDISENGNRPVWLVLIFTVSSILGSTAFSHEWPIWVIVLCVVVAIGCGVLLSMLPMSAPPDTFTCPFVPLVPLMGILSNCYMMGSMPLSTWFVIVGWLLLGLLFYFSYGIHHSELRRSRHGPTAEMSPVMATTKSGLLSGKNVSTTEGYDSIR